MLALVPSRVQGMALGTVGKRETTWRWVSSPSFLSFGVLLSSLETVFTYLISQSQELKWTSAAFITTGETSSNPERLQLLMEDWLRQKARLKKQTVRFGFKESQLLFLMTKIIQAIVKTFKHDGQVNPEGGSPQHHVVLSSFLIFFFF